jgi:hypothetical protein
LGILALYTHESHHFLKVVVAHPSVVSRDNQNGNFACFYGAELNAAITTAVTTANIFLRSHQSIVHFTLLPK